MEQRLNFVTLAVRDLAAARAFYVDGLGWRAAFEAPGEVVFVKVAAGVVLSLWARARFRAEVGVEPAAGPAPLSLAHNVGSPAEVDAALAAAVRAGGRLVRPAQRREWGGYSGYFADPDGFLWEVAHNPGPIGVEVLAESRAAAG